MRHSRLLSRLSRWFYVLIGIVALLIVMSVTGFASDIGTALVSRLPDLRFHTGVPYDGPTYLEERILSSDIIARVRMVSVSDGVETVDPKYILGGDSRFDRLYVKSLEYEFEVLEYLKGSDGNRIIGLVTELGTGPSYKTRLGASTLGESYLEYRDTRWDDREAIVFLRNNSLIPSTLQPGRYQLGIFDFSDSDEPTVASRISKRWLPAVSNTAGAMGNADKQFFTDDPEKEKYIGSQGETASEMVPSITVASLKALIDELEAEVSASVSPEEYRECRIQGYKWERGRGDKGGLRDIPDYYRRFHYGIPSGAAAGSQFYADARASGRLHYDPPGAPRAQYWLEGRDKNLFGAKHPGIVFLARPLPEGKYRFYYNDRERKYVICDAIPDFERNRRELFVQVTAPAGTLHEAFFDPVDIVDAVGADGSNGVLKPVSFSANSAIERIDWQSNAVSIAVSNPPSLADHHIDFIALDGSVALRLDFDDASVSDEGSTRTLRWKVCEQPWQSGDLLMLRISISEPNLTGVTNDTACDGDPTATPTAAPEPTATPTAEPNGFSSVFTSTSITANKRYSLRSRLSSASNSAARASDVSLASRSANFAARSCSARSSAASLASRSTSRACSASASVFSHSPLTASFRRNSV